MPVWLFPLSEAQGSVKTRSLPHAASQGCSDYGTVNAMKSIRQSSNPCTGPVGEAEWVTLSPRLKTSAEVQARKNQAPSCFVAEGGRLRLYWAKISALEWMTYCGNERMQQNLYVTIRDAALDHVMPYLPKCRFWFQGGENEWSFCIKGFSK